MCFVDSQELPLQYQFYPCRLILGSHCRLLSIDLDVHRQNEEFWHEPTKESRVNKVDDSLVDEVEHVLILVDFCR